MTATDKNVPEIFAAIDRGDTAEVLRWAKAGQGNVRGPFDHTPLMHAIQECEIEAAEALLPFSDVRASSRVNGRNALAIAVAMGGDTGGAAVKLVLPGSDLSEVNGKGRTVLHSAASMGNAPLAALLRPLVNPDIQDRQQETALEIAVWSQSLWVVKALASAGPNRVSGRNGEKAVSLALRRWRDLKSYNSTSLSEAAEIADFLATQWPTEEAIGAMREKNGIPLPMLLASLEHAQIQAEVQAAPPNGALEGKRWSNGRVSPKRVGPRI